MFLEGWRARWDLNPGFSAPEADALIRARLRALLQLSSWTTFIFGYCLIWVFWANLVDFV
jgi:hypothetical protein